MLDDLRPEVALDKLAQLVELRDGLECAARPGGQDCAAPLAAAPLAAVLRSPPALALRGGAGACACL